MNLLVRNAGPLNFLSGRQQLLYFINVGFLKLSITLGGPGLLLSSNEELVGTSLFLLFDFVALVIFG